ncbi:MAG: hypothetical protein AAGC68_03470, partial [Verrucomicrobiota bacterium]
ELGADPFVGFVERLWLAGALPETFREDSRRNELADGFRKDPETASRLGLFTALRESDPEGKVRLIILADQLEEFFVREDSFVETRESFFEVLELLAQSGLVWVLATIRSDFYSRAQTSPTLVRMRRNQSGIDLAPPDSDSIRQMVEEPAKRANLRWEEQGERSLANAIFQEARSQGELLPLLQYLLQELFEKRDDSDQLLFSVYEELGGVSGALSRRAEQVFESLGEEARAQFGNVMRRVATVDSERGEFVRRWADYEELTEEIAVSEFVDAFLDKDARLFVSKKSENDGGKTVVSVAHETLLTAWERLHDWLVQNRLNLKARTAISEDAQRWVEMEKNPDYLCPAGAQLDEGRRLLAEDYLETEERLFIEESLKLAAAISLSASLSTGKELLSRSAEVKEVFPETWLKVMERTLAEGDTEEKRNAADLLYRNPDARLSEALLSLIVSDKKEAVRYAAANALVVQRDDSIFERLDETSDQKDGANRLNASQRRETLGWILGASGMQEERPSFVDWFESQPRSIRRGVNLRARLIRFKRALPAFFFILIPAMAFAVAGAASVKWLPSIFNYSCVQATGSAMMGLFHSAPAGIILGGGIVIGLVLFRMVFGTEYGKSSFFQPFGAILFGGGFGLASGVLCTVTIMGVYDPGSLWGMGWLDKQEKLPFGEFLYHVFFVSKSGLLFPATSIGAGIGMALMTNGLRASRSWYEFLEKQSAIRSMRQLGDIVAGCIRVSLPYAFPIPIMIIAFAVIGLIASEREGYEDRFQNVYQEGVSVWMGGMDGVLKETHEINLTQAAESRVQWKKSTPGRALGLFGDGLAKVFGAYFCLVGMSLGIVAMRYGISLEPRITR